MKNLLFLLAFFPYCASIAQKTIALKPTFDDGISFHDFSPSADRNYGNSLWTIAHSQVSGIGNGINTGRTLIQFDFSSLPKDIIIKKALLNLYAYPNQAGPTYYGHNKDGGSNASYLRAITQPWIPNKVTWNTKPNSTDIDQVLFPESTSKFQDYKGIDVTTLVTKMVNNPTTNFGFELRVVEENPTRALIFCSLEVADNSKHPQLIIYYEDANPVVTNPNTTVPKDSIKTNIPTISCESEEKVYIPNSFSPNDDGINDYFSVYSNKELKINYLHVFDRWGNLVFEQKESLTNYDIQGWNGSFRGQPCVKGVYTYDIKITDTKGCTATAKSEIMLVR